MKNFALQGLVALSLLLMFAVFGGASSAAQAAPNLRVLNWQGSSSPFVESPYQYTTRVKNVGNQTAANVVMTVEFPLTNTSPNKFILGKLSGLQPGCSVASNKLVCAVGNVVPNQQVDVSFTFEFQVATTAPTITATATTTSSNEQNQNNNSKAKTVSPRYRNNVVSGGSYLVTSCTGRGLTSFYECELFPSSQQSFGIDLNPGGTILVPQAPGYFGFWDQNGQPSNRNLHFTIDGGGGTEVEFTGFAVSGNCFKGLAEFPGQTTYNAAYRVCEQ
ncbi:MAG: hypothetical protein AB7J13_04275 [Pyrinomonadaceae bacterium]